MNTHWDCDIDSNADGKKDAPFGASFFNDDGVQQNVISD